MASLVAEINKETNSKAGSNGDNASEETNEAKVKGKSRNPFIKSVTPEMLKNQYIDKETGEVSEEYTENYVYAKISREYVATLRVGHDEWIAVAEKSYQYYQETAARDEAKIVEDMLEKYKDNPRVMAILEQQIKAAKEVSKAA